MDDNAWPHRTLAVEELMESEDITRMDWPAYSPVLNLIEHLTKKNAKFILQLLPKLKAAETAKHKKPI
ncbi:hypothetical protein TNCV_481751 [Trichonephila clavipes]|nr:hypothetical protein TNCV_481751 [Trichonephila clavipes]